MKLKDIEKSLKKEHDGAKVPDVMRRAQKAPINRLLDGQRPLKAYFCYSAPCIDKLFSHTLTYAIKLTTHYYYFILTSQLSFKKI